MYSPFSRPLPIHTLTTRDAHKKSDEYLQSRLNAPEMEELAGLLSASRADLDGRLAKPEGSGSAVVDTKCVRSIK